MANEWNARYETEYGGGPGQGEILPDDTQKTLSAGELARKERRAGMRGDNASIEPGTVPLTGDPEGGLYRA